MKSTMGDKDPAERFPCLRCMKTFNGVVSVVYLFNKSERGYLVWPDWEVASLGDICSVPFKETEAFTGEITLHGS